MEIREAVETDAERLADIADAPTDAIRNLVHDRTVRVAVEEDGTGEGADDGSAEEPPDGGDETLLGFVSFDARPEAVHVTQLDGTAEACERLLAEPVAFAEREGMHVEFLVPASETARREAAEAAGFQEEGAGPRFEGEETVRYRLEP